MLDCPWAFCGGRRLDPDLWGICGDADRAESDGSGAPNAVRPARMPGLVDALVVHEGGAVGTWQASLGSRHRWLP